MRGLLSRFRSRPAHRPTLRINRRPDNYRADAAVTSLDAGLAAAFDRFDRHQDHARLQTELEDAWKGHG